jgi:molecular chaperone GrpE
MTTDERDMPLQGDPAHITDAGAPSMGAPAVPDAAHLETEPGEASAGQAAAPPPRVGEGLGERRDERADEPRALEERVAQLTAELAAERERTTDYMQKWQRAQADHANFRRRAQQEQEQLTALAAAQTMALVLPALDSLERAFKMLPESLYQLTWIEGITLVELQLRRALEAQGLSPFEPRPGDRLDLARHQAIAQTETSEHAEGTIIEVVQRGYELNGRALRPALVRVARAPNGTSAGSDAQSGVSAGATEPGSSP